MKKIILIIALLVIATLMISKADAQEAQNGLVNNQVVATSQASVIAAKFIKQVNILSQVKVETEILKSATFKSLQDFSVVIPGEAQGRVNPFAPF